MRIHSISFELIVVCFLNKGQVDDPNHPIFNPIFINPLSRVLLGCWNGSDSAIMTGSYNNFFRLESGIRYRNCQYSILFQKLDNNLLQSFLIQALGKTKVLFLYLAWL
jgi:hypothetical protein